MPPMTAPDPKMAIVTIATLKLESSKNSPTSTNAKQVKNGLHIVFVSLLTQAQHR
jgi:hypothetical protein